MKKEEIEKLYKENENLVYFMVQSKFHIRSGEPIYDDCVQEARFAMYRAIKRYDESKGVAISTYICKAIANALYYYIYSVSPIHITARGIEKKRQLSEKQVRGTITEEELSELNELDNLMYNYVSLDLEIESSDGSKVCLADSLAAPVYDTYDHGETPVADVIKTLIKDIKNIRHQEIMRSYYETIISGGTTNITKIAEQNGVTKQAVSQIIQRYNKKAQKLLRSVCYQ